MQSSKKANERLKVVEYEELRKELEICCSKSTFQDPNS